MSGAEAFETGISNEKPQHGKDAERTLAPLSLADGLVKYGSNRLAKSRLIGGIENA